MGAGPRSATSGQTAGRPLPLVPSPPDEAATLQAIAAGDLRALEALYGRWAALVLGFLIRLLGDREEAEEVVQDVFCTVWTTASQYDESRGTFDAWLHTIARHRAIDRLRRRRVRSDAAARLTAQPVEPAVDPAEQAWSQMRRHVVRRAMEELPERERQVLSRCYWDGLTQAEVAVDLGLPLGTVKTRCRSSLRRLARLLEEWGYASDL